MFGGIARYDQKLLKSSEFVVCQQTTHPHYQRVFLDSLKIQLLFPWQEGAFILPPFP